MRRAASLRYMHGYNGPNCCPACDSPVTGFVLDGRARLIYLVPCGHRSTNPAWCSKGQRQLTPFEIALMLLEAE